jgi:triosephosphate isomerase
MSQRKPLIVGNWKMHKSVGEALELATALKNAVAPTVRSRDREVVIAPPFTALYPLAKRLEGSTVALAAQNCHEASHGAFTGEISVPMLADVGCRWVIIGHSERRQQFGESDALVNRKAKAVLAAGLRPILCIGETLAERESSQTTTRIHSQLEGSLRDLSSSQLGDTVLAYEPVWAIGTGRVASDEQAQEVHQFIRNFLHSQFGEVAATVRILYGGSVKPNNTSGLMAQSDIDGVLVGGASLKAEDFLQIVNF